MAESKEKTCFVVMGFGEKTDFRTSRALDLDKSYRLIIKPAVEESGLKCVRADEIVHSGTIDVPMYEQLLEADLVIADLSTANVNAVYELGVRHALRPSATIVIAESQFSFPFDVNHIAIRTYEHLGKAIDYEEVLRFQGLLKDAIKQIMKEGRNDSPVYEFLKPLQPPAREASGLGESSREAPEPEASAAESQSIAVLMEQAKAAMDESNFETAKKLLSVVQTLAPHEDYVVQQLALATYKSKNPDTIAALMEARGILEALNPPGSNNAETLGLWGAIHKRLWEETNDRDHLDTSVFAYEKGFYLLNDYYNGINWAFLLNVRAAEAQKLPEAITDFTLAERVRRQVLEICNRRLAEVKTSDETKDERYWVLVTMAEAACGIGDATASERYLKEAVDLASADWMKASTKEQLEKLRRLLDDSPMRHIAA